MKTRTVSVSIALAPPLVYDFASNPENLPRWAPAFCKSVEYVDGTWVVHSPDGPVMIEFVEKNHLGVLDHTVTLSSGLKFYNPMRVVPNGSGSEVLFTLFQTSDMDEKKFDQDATFVENDLHTLKRVIETSMVDKSATRLGTASDGGR